MDSQTYPVAILCRIGFLSLFSGYPARAVRAASVRPSPSRSEASFASDIDYRRLDTDLDEDAFCPYQLQGLFFTSI